MNVQLDLLLFLLLLFLIAVQFVAFLLVFLLVQTRIGRVAVLAILALLLLLVLHHDLAGPVKEPMLQQGVQKIEHRLSIREDRLALILVRGPFRVEQTVDRFGGCCSERDEKIRVS